MTYQWTVIAYILYIEIAIVVVLMLPIATPKQWSRLFCGRVFSYVAAHLQIYLTIVLALMGLIWYDAVQAMRHVGSPDGHGSSSVLADLKNHTKLFRAQRNFYITGFSILLKFVIRTIIKMMHKQAELSDGCEKARQEFEDAIKIVREERIRIKMSQTDSENLRKLNDERSEHQKERDLMRQKIIKMTEEITAKAEQIEKLQNEHKESAAKNRINMCNLDCGDNNNC